MAISDEELVRQLEAVPLVETPEMKETILANLSVRRPAVIHRRRGLLIGLAWAAAVIVTSADRARDGASAPVMIAAASGAPRLREQRRCRRGAWIPTLSSS